LQAARTLAVLQVPPLDEPLARLADNPAEAPNIRVEALRAVLPRRPRLSAGAFEMLRGRLRDPDDPLNRLAAAEVLGRARLDDGQTRALLKEVRGDALVAPGVLLPALERSVTPQTAPALLDYLAEALRGGWRPAERELQQVLASLPKLPDGQQERLRQVHALWRQGAEGQRARLAQFEPLLTAGNAERGRAVFFDKKAACATCHRVGSQGGDIGPDLTRIGAIRSGRDILESVVLPSSTVAQGFDNYAVATADGRVVNGVIGRQTADTLVLRDSSGAEVRLRKDAVQEMRRLATSVMPEGLERTLTPDEFRDLLAFLQSLK
jgi:putative heme-binding domain-containing protein